jgi:F0F1-type ATP synthase membrane subunit b/b'
MTFNLDEVNKRTEESQDLLTAVHAKMVELKTEFDELVAECEAHELEYFKENIEAREKLSERIRDRLSMYGLLKEVAENLREKTQKDMVLVYEELRKEWGDI